MEIIPKPGSFDDGLNESSSDTSLLLLPIGQAEASVYRVVPNDAEGDGSQQALKIKTVVRMRVVHHGVHYHIVSYPRGLFNTWAVCTTHGRFVQLRRGLYTVFDPRLL